MSRNLPMSVRRKSLIFVSVFFGVISVLFWQKLYASGDECVNIIIPPEPTQLLPNNSTSGDSNLCLSELDAHAEALDKHLETLVSSMHELDKTEPEYLSALEAQVNEVRRTVLLSSNAISAFLSSWKTNLLLLFSGLAASISLVVAVVGFIADKKLESSMQKRMNAFVDEEQEKIREEINNEFSARAEEAKSTLDSQREENRHRILIGVYTNLSYFFWEQYHKDRGLPDEDDAEYLKNLETSINLSTYAKDNADDLEKLNTEEDHYILLTSANFDLAYHLATRNKGSDFYQALSLTDSYPEAVKRNREESKLIWRNWLETRAYVLMHSNVVDEIEKGLSIIDELAAYPASVVDSKWMESLFRKYDYLRAHAAKRLIDAGESEARAKAKSLIAELDKKAFDVYAISGDEHWPIIVDACIYVLWKSDDILSARDMFDRLSKVGGIEKSDWLEQRKELYAEVLKD